MTSLHRKVLLELTGLKAPIEMWWTDENYLEWQIFESSNKISATIRIPSSPLSILEFDIKILVGIQPTDCLNYFEEKSLSTCTQFYKYCQEVNLPFPVDTFNDEFEYPITIINQVTNDQTTSNTIDISNYVNLDCLLFKDQSIINFFMDEKRFLKGQFDPNRILYTEYSKLVLS